MLIRKLYNCKRSFIAYSFSSLQSLLSKHTFSIIDSNSEKYKQCREKMGKITSLSLSQSQTKKKLNIVFSIYNLPEPYQNLKFTLFQLLEEGKIQAQSDLDRLSKWLAVQLKRNNKIRKEDLIERLRTGQSKQECLKRIKQLKQRLGKEIDISTISKQIRQQFPGIDSKFIYQQIKTQFVNKDTKQSKQIWDKLYELKPRLLSYQTNTIEQTKEHQNITGGKLRFRFPPEPNGYLHIGHAKAIRTNFETAKQKGGVCYLRFDDTNPEKQSHEYIQNIINEVRWMGYEPDKITYASDYFQQLMEYANQLIKQGDAYVCETPKQDINEQRKNRQQNSYRLKPKNYSLKIFPHLEVNQTLRLKLDPKASNPTLRDPIIYRRKQTPHPRTGSKYKVYPTYDFTHCISDSIEHIDYSLCSLQFEVRRQLYYTILHLLNLYKPIVWEYSRLNIQGALLSKRKITKLVDTKEVEGWDDPRLMTLAGLRNRGYSPKMITNFIDKINVSRAGNQNITQSNLLELEMKKQLFGTAERTMVVLEPVKLKLINVSKKQVVVPLFPFDVSKGTRTIRLTDEIYIENGSNIKQGQVFGLKYVGMFKMIKNHPILEAEHVVQSVSQNKSKIKYIHWVPSTFTPCTVTEFHPLIHILPSGEQEYNRDNTKVYLNALASPHLDQTKTYQFERLGYYKFYKGKLICCVKL